MSHWFGLSGSGPGPRFHQLSGRCASNTFSQSGSNIGLRTHTPRLSIVSAPKSAVECPSCVSIGRSKRLHDGWWANEVGGAT